jgi:hypothetical protein
VENWVALTGPSGWFRLWHPPQWRIQEGNGSQTLSPPAGGGFIAVHAMWTRSPEQEPVSSPGSMSGPFPNARNVRPIADPGVENCLSSRTGESAFNLPAKWWKRPFFRAQWRAWQVWVLRKESIVIVATLVHGPDVDPELATLCRLLLQSVEFAEEPADPPEVFADRVLQLARRHFPLLECRLGESMQVVVGESVLNLFNFYRSYVRAPERFEEIVLPALTTVVQVQEWGDAQTRPPLDRVRDRIMPMLYPESVWKEKFGRFVGAPWVAGLAVLYVVDEAQAYWYIPQELLTDWRLSPDDLHDLSLENLERYFDEHPMELAVASTEAGAAALLMPDTSDAYNASRLVSGKFTARLREAAGGDLAIGLPGRDLFVAVSLKSTDMIEHVRGRVHEDFVNMDHPLTDRLLLVTADGVCEYCDPESD